MFLPLPRKRCARGRWTRNPGIVERADRLACNGQGNSCQNRTAQPWQGARTTGQRLPQLKRLAPGSGAVARPAAWHRVRCGRVVASEDSPVFGQTVGAVSGVGGAACGPYPDASPLCAKLVFRSSGMVEANKRPHVAQSDAAICCTENESGFKPLEALGCRPASRRLIEAALQSLRERNGNCSIPP